ncbi:hypothetical protein PYV61_21555 [Roseisolibacter sp. H3M3-2]|nr:hypothetical protein [Roseisolibacter sp. H3M3-2]
MLPALLSLAATLAPAPAHAQAECAAGTLAAYLAPGFACRIDAWAFDEFDYFTFVDASPGVSTFVPDAELLDVLPFRSVDADGRVSVGFEFLGLLSNVTTTASQRGDERGTAVAQVEFLAHSLLPAVGLVGARAGLSAVLDGTQPATAFALSQSFAQVVDIAGAGACLDAATLSPDTPGFASDEHAGTCADGPSRELVVLAGSIARLDRDGDDRAATLFAFTGGSVERVTLVTTQVVPEPSTLARAASGLVGLAAAARRRAGARAGATPRPPAS